MFAADSRMPQDGESDSRLERGIAGPSDVPLSPGRGGHVRRDFLATNERTAQPSAQIEAVGRSSGIRRYSGHAVPTHNVRGESTPGFRSVPRSPGMSDANR